MKAWLRMVLGVVWGGVFAVGQFSVALANGGDLHLGHVATGLPLVVVWAGGGVVGALILFFFISWGLSARNRGHSPEKEKGKQSTPS